MSGGHPAFLRLLVALCLLVIPSLARAEDGYDLWLRYRPVEASRVGEYRAHATEIVADCSTPTMRVACAELERGLTGLLGRAVPIRSVSAAKVHDGAILLAARHDTRLSSIGDEGYLIRTDRLSGHHVTAIAANREIGVLHGVFAYLRLIQTRQSGERLNIHSSPRYALRLLNHWDNLDRTVERGYAGPSIWDWASLPKIEQRYVDYARANASIGINGTVLSNVNPDPKILTSEYLTKVAALANVFRPYGIRVFLSVRFSSLIEIGGLKTADPLDPGVRAWWHAKADEIYRSIPDFGGFLVKANSEGQPGPNDYGRSHADGANAIAAALAPHGGTVFWRAFVYGGAKADRARQAYDQFKPLDGKFAGNVIVQVKNGPIDFQPREPFHPLFGQMPRTKVGLELQITREYLGQNSGVVYLAPMWSEVLASDTCSPRCGTPVSATVAAIAGVANVGSDRNWTGNHFDQANWYAFGRLAWDPKLTPRQIADEWTRMTWSNDPGLVGAISNMMMISREATVDYMTPLGLAHQFAGGHHYGPGPWECSAAQASWNPCFYNQADAHGIGFDRTVTGSDAVAQYPPPIALRFASLATVPDKYLLWFHHLPWTYRMRSGRSFWDELVAHYDGGVDEVAAMRRQWSALKPFVDPQRDCQVAASLVWQQEEAHWWRDASIAYWQSLSRLPLPKGAASPPHPLQYYESIKIAAVPGFNIPKLDRIDRCWPAATPER